MEKARILINKCFVIGNADENIFSSFIEHMGRGVYGGIYDPQSKNADSDGFRSDVIDAIREMGVKKVRYPGGNFVSGYDWKDGIGDKNSRPRKLNLAWNQTETNEVGVDEFMKFAKKAGVSPIMAINLGTGSVQSAADLVEYCNSDTDTKWANERRKNGNSAPYGIKYWCLGNEMDGEWQICHKSADEYGRIATETAKMMKWVDPDIKLTLCGSSGSAMPTYPEWDRIVLEYAYEYVDYISLHKYYEYPLRDVGRREDFLASYLDFDSFIASVSSTVNYVKTLKRSKHDVRLSIDEWNVWHTGRQPAYEKKWEISAPREENIYDMIDTTVFSSLICTLLNHCDTVKFACLAQLVNVLAPIITGEDGKLLRQSIFYPFMLAAEHCCGEVMRTVVDCGNFDSVYGKADNICCSAVLSGDKLTVLAVNLSDKETEVDIVAEHFGNVAVTSNTSIADEDCFACNTFENPDRILPHTEYYPEGKTTVRVKPYSVNFLFLSNVG